MTHKDFRQVIADMGITKEEVREEIRKTVDSMVRGALSANLDAALQRLIMDHVNSYRYGADFKKAVEQATKEIITGQLTSKISISVTLKE